MSLSSALHPDDLRRSLRTGGLDIAYQGQWDLASTGDDDPRNARPVAVEALARWSHPEFGEVPPDVFIPLAEEGGFLETLDTDVLQRAVRQVATWRAAGHDLALSVNAAPTHMSVAYADAVIRCAEGAGLEPPALTIEIVETPSPQFSSAMGEALSRLDRAGITVSVDDFGVGGTALHTLEGLPIREVKLDRSLVQRVDVQADRIIGQVIDAADRHGWRVVAEGIETVDDLNRSTRRRCHRGQGFLWGRAIPAADFEQLLARSGA
ncbi:EAL domain-containing protein [Microbacterium mangrovi]|nr:EAL domain-containing protein [Microbacterium mangrovi]